MRPTSQTATTTEQLEQLWTQHHQTARRHLLTKLRDHGDRELVDDAISEATMRLWRTLTRGRPVSNPAAWMCLVSWREYLRLQEQRTARGRLTLTDHLPEPAGTSHGDPVPEEVLDEVADQQVARAFRLAIAGLSPIQRAVITDYSRGLTYREIADRHHISLSATNKAIDRAKRNLAKDARLQTAIRARHP